MGRLTTHVLDQYRGRPAAGIRICLYRMDQDAAPAKVAEAATNDDGRLDQPILSDTAMREGTYQLEFDAAAYFQMTGTPLASGSFLDVVVIRFVISSKDEHYHVPLLLSPYGYATYRGS
ncbi:MAG: hydroxyisourate hydrolase [Pseudomonadota bacterium]